MTHNIDADKIKAEASLVDYVSNSGVALKKKGREYWGCCPFHDEKTPSFSVFDKGGQRFYCQGCGAGGDIFEYAKKFYGYGFKEAAAHITGRAPADLSALNRGAGSDEERARRERQRAQREAQEAKEAAEKLEKAKNIYKAGLRGAPEIENYLLNRGIEAARFGGVPPSLRFAENLYHGPSRAHLPAMLAPIQSKTGHMIGLHRTYLEKRGERYIKARTEPAKMVMAGMRGGAIRLGPIMPRLMIAEGIENALTIKMFYPKVFVLLISNKIMKK